MADFDDLLPPPNRSAPAPVFDNPFQDVFDGVSGRPRSPDPWSTGGWGEPEPEPTFPVTVGSSTSPPTSPGGFKEFNQSHSFESELQSSAQEPSSAVNASLTISSGSPVQLHRPPLNSDPLGSDLPDPDETPAKRNPLGPLPPAPKLPDPLPNPPPATKPEASTVPAAAEVQSATVTPALLPVVIEPVASSAAPVDIVEPTGIPTLPSTSTTTTQGSIPSPLDSATLSQGPRIIPAIPPSPLTPHPPTPGSSSGFSSFRDRSVSESTSADSNGSLTATDSTRDVRYGRIVSPLETPPATLAKRTSLEQGFSNLALGGEVPGWGGSTATAAATAAPQGFGGYGATQDEGQSAFGDGFGERRSADTVSPTHSVVTVKEEDVDNTNSHDDDDAVLAPPQPTFIIAVGDPQKVGDPISAHIVYTVQTRTTSPLFSKSSFSVLRRYSDFLWLYEALSANNPGVIVPPVPEKNPFSISRFESDFVESRRLGLNKCVQKIANHPVLNKDEDFKFFLESDTFALDIKHRRGETSQAGGLLATFGSLAAPRFYEIDDWFDNKRAYLDALESQLKGLVKAIEIVSRQRADFAITVSEFADTIAALSQSDLSKQLTQSLSVLTDVERLYKDMLDNQAKDDMMTIMGTADEYSRLINSVRLAFNSRIKLYFAWQSADTDSRRIKSSHEKARRQGRSTGSMAEIAEADRRAQDAKVEFDTVTKLIKMELGRFESERVEDFKIALEQFLEGMIRKQQALILAWENYQNILLKRAAANPSGAVGESTEVEDI